MCGRRRETVKAVSFLWSWGGREHGGTDFGRFAPGMVRHAARAAMRGGRRCLIGARARPGPHRRLRCDHRAWAGGGRHGRPLVRGRHRHSRRAHRSHRAARQGGRQAAHRCSGTGGRARIHRHAGPVRAHAPRRTARTLENLSGHHHRDHRRGKLRRAGQRCDREGERGPLRASADQAGLVGFRRLLRAAGETGHRHQPRLLRRRDHGARDGGRL